MRFTSTRVRDAGDGTLHVEGDLEAAGKVVPLEFDATVKQVDDGLEVEATTTVDQRQLGMSSGQLGMIRPTRDAARQGTPERMTARHRVVIVGGGFGGLAAAKALRRAPVDVTVVDRQAHHLFQPLLYQVATGVLSQGNIAPPLRDVLRHQRNAEVVLAEVGGVDLERRTVTCSLLDRTLRASVRQSDRRRRLGDSRTSATTSSPSTPRV